MARFLAPAALLATLAPMAAAAAAHAPAAVPDDNKAIAALLNCRAIADGAARLACFDGQAAALAAATSARTIVVLDREQVRRTKRSLFGFELPTLDLFGGKPDAKEEAEAREISATVRSAGLNRDGRWTVTLEDGARWVQTDDRTIALPPHPGSAVVIRRAALGSFFLRVDGQPGVKAQRVG